MKKTVRDYLHSFALNMLLVFASIIISIVLVEWGLGKTSLRYVNYAGQQSQKYFYQYYSPNKSRGFDIRPNVPKRQMRFSDGEFNIWSNNIGCFDRDVDIEKVRNEGYILLVGDSFTWGFTDFEDTAGLRLENKVHKRVLKCGVPSYGTHQELLKARDVIDKIGAPPDKLILGYYVGNDVLNDYFFPELVVNHGYLTRTVGKFNVETGEVSRRGQYDHRKKEKNFEKYCVGYKPEKEYLFRLRCWLTRNSVLYQLYNLITRPKTFYPPYELIWTREEEQLPWMRSAWRKHLGGMRENIELLGIDKEDLLVVIIPAKNNFVPKYWEDARKARPGVAIDPAAPYRMLANYLEKNRMKFINLLPYFKSCGGLDLYWTFDGHWNSSGNRVMADIVYNSISGNYSPPEQFCNTFSYKWSAGE